MVKAIVFNCSTKYYNRGTAALGYWLQVQGWQVEHFTIQPDLFSLNADLFCFSAIFTWHLPRLVEWAVRVEGDRGRCTGHPSDNRTPARLSARSGQDPRRLSGPGWIVGWSQHVGMPGREVPTRRRARLPRRRVCVAP